MIIPRDDMLDDLMSDEDEGDHDDYTEPSFGSDSYSAGLLSTIWEEHTQRSGASTVGSAVSSKKSAGGSVVPMYCSRSSIWHDSANRDLFDDPTARDLWLRSNSGDSVATSEAPLYHEDDYSIETLDSGKIQESDRKMAKRWSSEMSYSSMSISSGSTGGLISASTEGSAEGPRAMPRRRSLVRSLSDSSLNSATSTSKKNETSVGPALEEALDQLDKDSFRLQRKSVLEMGRDALLKQLMEAYLQHPVEEGGGDGGEADVGNSTHSSQSKARLSLDTYLAASIANEGLRGGRMRRNQPPGKPIRRFSLDGSDAGDSVFSALSGESLADRLRRLPDANAFNADDDDHHHQQQYDMDETPPVATRKRQEGRRRPPGMPVRQNSFVHDEIPDWSESNNAEQDSVDGDTSSANSFRKSGSSKRRGSYLSISSADMTIEEGDEDAVSSDDETLDSDALNSDVEDEVPPSFSREYMKPLKGDNGADLEENEDNVPRQYLAPYKGSEREEEDDLDLCQDQHRQYLLPLKGVDPNVPSKESSSVEGVEQTKKHQEQNDGDSAVPATQTLPAVPVPKITSIPIPPAEERVDASFVVENHLLKEQGPNSPGTLVRRRSNGGKRKIKYDMARSAVSPKLDRLLSPVGKVAPVTDRNLDKLKTATDPGLTIPPMGDGRPPRPRPPPTSSPRSMSSSSKEVTDSDPASDPEQSPLGKKPKVRRNKDNKLIRVRSNKNLQQEEITDAVAADAGLSSSIIPNNIMVGDEVDSIDQSSSTQFTETTTSSTFLAEGSSELDMVDATNQLILGHSNHSRTSSRSTRMNMAGGLDVSDHTSGPPTLSPRSPNMDPTSGGDDRSLSSPKSTMSNKPPGALKKGLQRGKRRLQKMFRSSSLEVESSEGSSGFSLQ